MRKTITIFTKHHILLIFVLLFLVNESFSQSYEIKNSLDKISNEYTNRKKPPGLAITVIKDNKVFWSYKYGYSDIEKKTAMNSDLIMNIASVSKTITTTAILQLWERGAVNLDDDINKYLNFKVANPNHPKKIITIKQLLTHSSSITESVEYGNSYLCGDPVMPLSDWLKNYFDINGKFYNEENNFHPWKPGENYKYSNIAFGLLGLIVEEVSKQPFNEYCKKNIMLPLKMDNSSWFINDLDTSELVKQYAKASEDNRNSEWVSKLIKSQIEDYFELCNYSFYNYPDGLFKTTITELSHFMIAMMNEGKYNNHQILKPSTVSEMLTLQVKDYDIQGLGWKKINYGTFSFWGHSGRDPGVRTHMYFNPDTKIGIILFQNNGEGSTIKLVENIYSLIIE